ncbi:MAG TPA: NAD(P)/FAD-dependent oxidoreductase [Acidimicrobiia bacterium]|nr:NAD(P)/FAD-dependent oxidoreductase [Acidimicrobiia bacterium]
MELDVVVVGAGFAGLYMLHRLRGLGLAARIVERGDGVGGTWYWNRYPGARCDVESVVYSYSFDEALQQEWTWSERYAPQAEILAYLEHVADRFELRDDIILGTSVVSAHWADDSRTWAVRTERSDGSGPGPAITARVVIMATGCLSSASVPAIPGIETFAGDRYHTGAWPHDGVDFTGRRVAVIGTGSSGIQSIPVIAAEADHTYVLQRTANFSAPAWNRRLEPAELEAVKANYGELRGRVRAAFAHLPHEVRDVSATRTPAGERRAILDAVWAEGGLNVTWAFPDVLTDPEANGVVADYVRDKIRATVRDPATAAKLTPTDHPIASKRLCVDTGYWETFNRDDVTLVDLRETPIVEIVPEGIRTGGDGGTTIAVDTIVFATGFDAMTGSLLRIDIRGRGGVALTDKWADGPVTYLGLAMAGFPNLFTITGPGSPSVLTNMVPTIEQHVDWITDCLAHLRAEGAATIEADTSAETEWTQLVDLVASATLMPRANSWYMGRNIEGKPVRFMPWIGGAPAYRQMADQIAAEGYKGFIIEPARR